jgi:hypothetical protein
MVGSIDARDVFEDVMRFQPTSNAVRDDADTDGAGGGSAEGDEKGDGRGAESQHGHLHAFRQREGIAEIVAG